MNKVNRMRDTVKDSWLLTCIRRISGRCSWRHGFDWITLIEVYSVMVTSAFGSFRQTWRTTSPMEGYTRYRWFGIGRPVRTGSGPRTNATRTDRRNRLRGTWCGRCKRTRPGAAGIWSPRMPWMWRWWVWSNSMFIIHVWARGPTGWREKRLCRGSGRGGRCTLP